MWITVLYITLCVCGIEHRGITSLNYPSRQTTWNADSLLVQYWATVYGTPNGNPIALVQITYPVYIIEFLMLCPVLNIFLTLSNMLEFSFSFGHTWINFQSLVYRLKITWASPRVSIYQKSGSLGGGINYHKRGFDWVYNVVVSDNME